MNSSRTLSLALATAMIVAPLSVCAQKDAYGNEITRTRRVTEWMQDHPYLTGTVAAVTIIGASLTGAQYAGYDVKGMLKLDKVSLPEMPKFAKTGYNNAAEKVGALLAWAKSFVWSASEAA